MPPASSDIPTPEAQAIPNPSWAPPAPLTGPDADIYPGGIGDPSFGQPTPLQPVYPRGTNPQPVPNPSWAPPGPMTGPNADIYPGGIGNPRFGRPGPMRPVQPRRGILR